jgi:DNA-binding MurR/RpiR family transcriptional regulator
MQALDQLPKAERQLADMILQSPGQMASYSASEIARMAGVSNATMTRLVQRLGYESYEQMRRVAREGMNWGSPLFLLDREEEQQSGTRKDPFADHISASIRNITDSFAGIQPSMIEAIGKQAAQARQVRIFGQRNNYFFAAYLRWQFIQFRNNVYLLPVSGETLAEYLVGLMPDDLFIVFGLRRRQPGLGKLISAVKQAGVKMVLITDAASNEDLGVEWTLNCQTSSPIPLDNHVAVLALCHVLSAQLIVHAGIKGRQRLARIEDLHAQLEEF